MKRTILLVLTAACAVGLGYGLAAAQDDPPPIQLSAKDVSVTAFESITVRAKENSTVGVTETLRKDGHVILLVELDVDAPWSEELERLSVSGKDIVLVGEDDQSHAPIGHMQWGTFSEFTPSLSLRRPKKWPEQLDPKAFNAAFLVPAEARNFTLQFGGHLSVPVTAPTETSDEPHVADKMQVEIISAKLVDELHGSMDIGKEKIPTDLVSEAGPFLEVTFKLTPLAANGSFENIFFWHSDWFGVRFADGSHSHTTGEVFMGKLSRNVSHNTPLTGDGWQPATAIFYFPASADAQPFTLLALMGEIAEGTVTP